jgi:hypothetical protein
MDVKAATQCADGRRMRLGAHALQLHRRSTSLAIAATLIVVVGLFLGCGLAQVAQATQAPAAAQLLHAALADATARGSVHQTVTEISGGKTLTFSDDVAATEGRQQITISGGARAGVLVFAGVAYISGNQTALVDYFGFPASVARQLGDRWMSIPSSSSDYSTLAAAATLASALTEITPVGPLTETAPTQMDGESVVGISGRAPSLYGQPGTLTTYVTRSSRPLPVQVTASLKANGHTPAGHTTSSLTDWGEHLVLRPPPNAIPASKL